MPQTQLYTKKAQVFLIEETTVDTYLVQTAASAILAEIPESPLTLESNNYEPTTVRGDFLSSDETPGMTEGTISFRVPMHGDGGTVAGVAPEYQEALKACGMSEVVDPGVSVTYHPLSTFDGAGGNPGQSYSVTVVEDGVAYRLKGCFGNVVFNGTVGDPMFAEFEFKGAHEPIIDDALETTSYDILAAPSFKGATFATNFGGAYTPLGVNNFTLDLGNIIAVRKDINGTNGVLGARITGRKSIGTFDPEMTLVSGEDFYGTWLAGTTGTIATGVIGSAVSNKFSLTVNRSVTRPPQMGARDGVRINTIEYAVSSAGADVEGTNLDITLAFT